MLIPAQPRRPCGLLCAQMCAHCVCVIEKRECKRAACLCLSVCVSNKKLKQLYLISRTQITDAGCAALAAALDSGALPALERLVLDGNIPASAAAMAAVHEALARSRSSAPS